ncbi:hypothetical protein PoB_007523700 [Plakobranchus ocellatus]|uniref:Uncharacterized protein n=1 Tax=Plakobranchus ocellatus TaxID=259542 RepID=A0AAV4DWQ2_9GAST|nr:hypothetical protein PoB_007523700 [Plakobranchus ocellatus]
MEPLLVLTQTLLGDKGPADLDNVGQCCPPMSGKKSGQGDVLMIDKPLLPGCHLLNLQDPSLPRYPRNLMANKAPTLYFFFFTSAKDYGEKKFGTAGREADRTIAHKGNGERRKKSKVVGK